MATYPLPPGAWLSGRAGASLTPIGPPRAGNTPIGPPRASTTPIGPPHAGATPIGPPALGADTPIGPPRPARVQPTPAPFPVPWDGIDPPWVYDGDAALLGQALRKSRSKVVRGEERRLTPELIRQAAQGGRRIDGTALWRWAGEFRVSALQSALLARLQVRGTALWLVDAVAADAAPGGATIGIRRVFGITRARGADVFADQIDKVLRAAVEREDRLPEILSQADDFWPFFESIIGLRLAMSPRLTELLDTAHGVALHLLMALKHGVAAQRPVQCSTLVMPVIPTPGHGSLPSGHATISALNVELLAHLMYDGGDAFSLQRVEQLDRLARRIAFNRVVAGVHFPFDSLVGYALGTQLGRLFAALAGRGRGWPAEVDDDTFDALDAGLELKESDGRRPPRTRGPYASQPEPDFAELWRRTREELDRLRV